jgi:hypothetical protein
MKRWVAENTSPWGYPRPSRISISTWGLLDTRPTPPRNAIVLLNRRNMWVARVVTVPQPFDDASQIDIVYRTRFIGPVTVAGALDRDGRLSDRLAHG